MVKYVLINYTFYNNFILSFIFTGAISSNCGLGLPVNSAHAPFIKNDGKVVISVSLSGVQQTSYTPGQIYDVTLTSSTSATGFLIGANPITNNGGGGAITNGSTGKTLTCTGRNAHWTQSSSGRYTTVTAKWIAPLAAVGSISVEGGVYRGPFGSATEGSIATVTLSAANPTTTTTTATVPTTTTLPPTTTTTTVASTTTKAVTTQVGTTTTVAPTTTTTIPSSSLPTSSTTTNKTTTRTRTYYDDKEHDDEGDYYTTKPKSTTTTKSSLPTSTKPTTIVDTTSTVMPSTTAEFTTASTTEATTEATTTTSEEPTTSMETSVEQPSPSSEIAFTEPQPDGQIIGVGAALNDGEQNGADIKQNESAAPSSGHIIIVAFILAACVAVVSLLVYSLVATTTLFAMNKKGKKTKKVNNPIPTATRDVRSPSETVNPAYKLEAINMV